MRGRWPERRLRHPIKFRLMTDWIRWKRGKGTRCKRGRAIMHFVGAAAAAGNEAWSQQTCEQRLGSPNAPARACAIACVQVVGGLPSFWIQISNIWNLHLVSSMPPHLLFPDTVFRFFQITRNTLKFPTEDSSTAARFWKLHEVSDGRFQHGCPFLETPRSFRRKIPARLPVSGNLNKISVEYSWNIPVLVYETTPCFMFPVFLHWIWVVNYGEVSKNLILGLKSPKLGSETWETPTKNLNFTSEVSNSKLSVRNNWTCFGLKVYCWKHQKWSHVTKIQEFSWSFTNRPKIPQR